MFNSIPVGLGEIKISHDPKVVLVAFGLGSCLGIGMYDSVVGVAGLLHAILPAPQNGSNERSSKYVSSGVQMLLEDVVRAGAVPARLKIRMAGGAQMLVAPGFSQVLNIGPRNVEAAYLVMKSLNLKILGQEVGGTTGRTVRFYPADGRMTIRTVGNQEREI
jgi:chemotaxis protein CheD